MNPIVRASKFLSLVLRHNPGSVGINLDAAGWVEVDVLLAALPTWLNRELFDRAVAENNKQRFEFSADGLRIRARQGHSVEVDLGYERVVPPNTLYHGTSAHALPAILRDGIHRMSRHAVHLSADVETAVSVGGRHGRPAVLVVLARRLAETGVPFTRTDNGVWLTEHVPPTYLLRPCSECLLPVDRLFMVHDDLWTSAVEDVKELLHAECLEKRLGRPLTLNDFTTAPINEMEGFVPRRALR